MCIQGLGHFSPFLRTQPPPPPGYQAETVLPLSLILLKKSISNNRKDQGFAS
jgi:hypothetical protein